MTTGISKFQWHPEVHERWGNERLHFWFLSYRSTYDRKAYIKSLEQLFQEIGVGSYTIYELKGGYDLLARAWIPHTVRTADLTDHLYSLDKMSEAEHFRVQETYRHWPWRDRKAGNFEIQKPDVIAVDAGAVVPDLLALNAINEQAIITEVDDESRNGVKHDLSRQAQAELLKQYERAHLLVRPGYRSKGIKFVVLVTSQRGNNPDDLKVISSELSETLDKACRAGAINEASLYFGQGFDSGRHMILARTPHARYHDVNERVLKPINRLTGLTRMRTHTYDMVASSFAAHRELLPVEEPDRPVVPGDGAELLAREESQTLETKGSGIVDMDRWIKKDGRREASSDAIGKVARAIVALLNTEGGIVVLGALEEQKFPETADPHGNLGKHDELRVGNFLCAGVDWEIGNRKGWDNYILHLRRKVLERISGGSSFWIDDFEKRVVRTPDGKNRTIVAIPLRQPDEWFWFDKQFVVRRGPESVTLDPKEVTEYMRVMGARGGWRRQRQR